MEISPREFKIILSLNKAVLEIYHPPISPALANKLSASTSPVKWPLVIQHSPSQFILKFL
jgi:hypothetical protein